MATDAARSFLSTLLPGPRLIACGAAALLALFVYANALFNPFVYDDHRLILENTSIQYLADWRAIVVHDMTRPLVNFSYALDYAIWRGRSPFGFHFTNVLIHAANVVLLFQLGFALATDFASQAPSRVASPLTVASAASVLFAVHPLLSQAVGYVSARSELVCTTFYLLALLAARRALQGRGLGWWAAALGAWLLALASRETAATLPVVLACYDFSNSHGAPRPLITAGTPPPPQLLRASALRNGSRLSLAQGASKRTYLYVALTALTLGAALVRVNVLTGIEHPGGVTIHWRYGLVELDVFGRYLGLMVAPVGQTIFHAIAPIQTLFQPRTILALLTGAGYVLMFIVAFRKNRLAAFGLAWFAIVLLPAAALVMLDRGEPMAEHRVYLASGGLFLSAGAAAAAIEARCRFVGPTLVRQARLVVVLIVIVLSVRTISRNTVWSHPVALWLEAAEYAPNHWLPRLGLGEALHTEGRHEEAIPPFRAAVRFRPTEAQAWAKLGRCLLETGRLDEANEAFQTLLRIDRESPLPYGGLGTLAMQTGDWDVARRYFLEVLRRDPRSIAARQILASLEEASNPAESLRLCEEIERLAPQTAGAAECISRSRARLGTPGGR